RPISAVPKALEPEFLILGSDLSRELRTESSIRPIDRSSGRAVYRVAESPFVDPVLLHHAPVHRFQAGVHVAVRLQYEPRLAVFQVRVRRGFEMFEVEQSRDAGPLPLGLDAEETDTELVAVAVSGDEIPPAGREDLALHPFLHLIAVDQRDRHRDHLAVLFGDYDPFRREDQLKLERV